MNKNSNKPTPSPWGYFGYEFLFAIPIIGLIFMLIFAFDNSNPARRNFARSKFIPFLIWGILAAGLLIFAAIIYVQNGWSFD